MFGLWGSLRGKVTTSGVEGRNEGLTRLLSTYPPHQPRHPGDAARLGSAEGEPEPPTW